MLHLGIWPTRWARAVDASRRTVRRMYKRLPSILIPVCLLAVASMAAAGQPGGVARYRTGTPDPRAHRVPAEIQRGVFAEPERYLGPLVESLLAGVDDEFHRVKILHDWVAEHIAYDAESFLTGMKVESAFENTLRRRQAVCHGYATLLAKMCELAGIPCRNISGYGRGYRFGLGRTESVGRTNHAWNAVKIGGRWYLVDVTWDAGHVNGRTYRKAFGTAYLFPEPREFLYTHFPTDPKWQLLDPPCTAEEFARLPYLRGRFFEHGLRLLTRLGRVSRAGASVQIDLEVPADVVISAKLNGTGGADPVRRTLIQREGTGCKILATFPGPGRWRIQLFSKHRDDDGSLSLAASLEFDAAEGTDRTFPKTFGSYGTMGACLYSPLYAPLRPGRSETFRIRAPGAGEVSLVIGKQPWLPLRRSRTEPDVYQLTAKIPPGLPVSLTAKNSAGGGSHWTLVDFTPGEKKEAARGRP